MPRCRWWRFHSKWKEDDRNDDGWSEESPNSSYHLTPFCCFRMMENEFFCGLFKTGSSTCHGWTILCKMSTHKQVTNCYFYSRFFLGNSRCGWQAQMIYWNWISDLKQKIIFAVKFGKFKNRNVKNRVPNICANKVTKYWRNVGNYYFTRIINF